MSMIKTRDLDSVGVFDTSSTATNVRAKPRKYRAIDVPAVVAAVGLERERTVKDAKNLVCENKSNENSDSLIKIKNSSKSYNRVIN